MYQYKFKISAHKPVWMYSAHQIFNYLPISYILTALQYWSLQINVLIVSKTMNLKK